MLQRVVVSAEEAEANIGRYNSEMTGHPRLAARIRQHPAWYAIPASDGGWMFGPSKFVGYHGANAQAYLASYSRKGGSVTEPALQQWFIKVDPESGLGKDLRAAFIAWAGKFGKTPHVNWRVSVPRGFAASAPGSRAASPALSKRIAFDREICGGRARIAGTRMRVSDLVAMIADGAERAEILQDFPYLKDEDISAALAYAAQSVDHRIMHAA